MKLFVIFAYLIQRLFELYINKVHIQNLSLDYEIKYASIYDSLRMKMLHSFWFLALIIESFVQNDFIKNIYFWPIIFVLILLQWFRIRIISKLGKWWVVDILTISPEIKIEGWEYSFIRHPNYFIVVLEFILVPLVLKCYFTLILFSFLNLINLYFRIQLEEKYLLKSENAEKFFAIKYRLIPFVI